MAVKEKSTVEFHDIDVRDYLRLSFELVNNKLSSIDDKATKTENSVQGVIRTINQMQILDAGHFTSCPNTVSFAVLDKRLDKEIQIIEAKFSEFEFMKRYWKVFAITAAVFVCALLITGYVAFGRIEEIIVNAKNKPTTEYEIPAKQFPQPNHIATTKPGNN